MNLKIFIILIFQFFTAFCTSRQPGEAIQHKDTIYTYKTPSADGTGKFYMGREIAQVMGFSGAEWLERDSRQREENVRLAIENLPLKENSVVADIGAGTGYYTFRIAPKIPNGKVYAVELQEDAINFLKKQAAELKVNNVKVVKGSENRPSYLQIAQTLLLW